MVSPEPTVSETSLPVPEPDEPLDSGRASAQCQANTRARYACITALERNGAR